MEYAAHLRRKRLKNCQRLLEAIAAGVNDTIQAGLRGDFELLLKYLPLPSLYMRVFCRAAAIRTWQAEIIQPGLANGDYLWVTRQLPQFGAKITWSTQSFVRVPAHHCEDGLKSLGQCDRLRTALQVRPDTHHPCDACSSRTVDKLRQLLGKLRVVQMRVRVVKFCHEQGQPGWLQFP